MKKEYIEKAEISDPPEELMAQVGPLSSEVSVAPAGLTRPKKAVRPKSIEASGTKFPGYMLIKDFSVAKKNGKTGRHFIFMLRGDGWTQFMVNVDPYFDEVIQDAKEFYYHLKGEYGIRMKQVSNRAMASDSFLVKRAKEMVIEENIHGNEPESEDDSPTVDTVDTLHPQEFEFAKKMDEDSSHKGAIMAWFDKYRNVTSQYFGYSSGPSWPQYERYTEELREYSYELFESVDNSKLSFLLESIFKKSTQYARMKGELMKIHYEENPLKERTVRSLEKRIDEMSDAAIAIVLPEFKRWIYRHDVFDGWWSEFAYSLLTEGAADNMTCEFDLSEDIIEKANVAVRELVAQEYDVSSYAESYMYEYVESRKDDVVNYIRNYHSEELSDFISANDIEDMDDFDSYIIDFIDEHSLHYDIANETNFEEWLSGEDSPLGNFESFGDALEWFGDGNPTWIEIVKGVAQEHGMGMWKDCYPGMDDIESNVRYAISMMEDADTPLKKAAALSYALNVQHYYGKMMDDHVADGLDLSHLTGLDVDELDRLSNLEASFSDAMIKTADSVWTQSQVYCEDGVCYDVEKLIESTAMNRIVRIKVDELTKQLHENAWGDDSLYVSPMSVINKPLLNRDHKIHMRRIQTADMSNPILIRFRDGKIIDGYHRLARAFMNKDRYISAIYIQDEQFGRAEIKS